MAFIQSFRDLQVYQLARTNTRKIFLISRSFPTEEKFCLVNQIRRSSRAVNAMIAEAWARRSYPAAFANKISEALGEQWKRKHGWIMRLIVNICGNKNSMNWIRHGSKSAECSAE